MTVVLIERQLFVQFQTIRGVEKFQKSKASCGWNHYLETIDTCMASSDVLMVSNEWIDALCVIYVFFIAFTTACLGRRRVCLDHRHRSESGVV